MTDLTGTALRDVPADHLQRLRAGFASRAEDAGLLDVAYRSLDTPIGRLLLAGTVRGVVRIAFPVEDPDQVLATLATRVSPRILCAPRRLDPLVRQLDGYFTRQRTAFDVPVDLQLVSAFRQEVLAHLARIPYGATESYRQVAAAVGRPKAVRAAGSACATNPVPIVVPCHRVVRSDGSLGGYAGGLDVKTALLTMESTTT